MAFTDQSDFYTAVHDEGINTVVRHIMRQRPSLFNYGTALVQANPGLLCEPINAAPAVTRLVEVMDPLPLPGADNLALDFAVQITDLEIDFHPGNAFTLPPELDPPLGAQRVAFRVRFCGGLSCVPKEVLRGIPTDLIVPGKQVMVRRRAVGASGLGFSKIAGRERFTGKTGMLPGVRELALERAILPLDRLIARPPVVIVPTDKLECFCIELFGVGHAAFTGQAGNQRLLIGIDGIELVDIEPKGIENSIECYIYLLLDRVVLPQVSDAISEIAFRLHEFPPLPDDPSGSNSIQLSASTTAPNNPAVEEDQLKLFIDLEQLQLNIPPITVGEDGPPAEEGPAPTRTERSRTRTGPSHLTAAVSEDVVRRVFAVVRDAGRFKITVAPQSVTILGVTGTAKAKIEFHLDNGTVEFDDNTVRIDELDIKWDKLEVTLGLDLPELCFSACIPFTDICTELGCLFEGESDFSFTIPLPTIFTTEISLNAGPKVYYGIGSPNEWMIHLDPSRVDLDIIDIADTAGDLLDGALDAAIEALGLPDWADFLADGFVDLVRGLLDIPDDVGEWLQDLIFDTLGVETTISSYISDWLADGTPIFRLEDPVQVMEADPDKKLIPVTIPIQFIGARVNADEMIIEVDIGG